MLVPFIFKKPIDGNTLITLADMPENIPCVISYDKVSLWSELMLRIRQDKRVYSVCCDNAGKFKELAHTGSDPKKYYVISRLDGQPLPKPPVEENRFYKVTPRELVCKIEDRFYKAELGSEDVFYAVYEINGNHYLEYNEPTEYCLRFEDI